MLLVSEVAVRGLAAAAVALFVSRSALTDPLRARTSGLLAEGLGCPYCCAGWTSLALCAVYPTSPLGLAWLASWGAAGLVAAAIDRLVGD